MTPKHYIQYRNENLQRNFPFADDRTLVDSEGRQLPQNYFIDGSIFPINETTPVYLSALSGVYVEISCNGAVIATGSLADGVVDLVDSYDRHIGLLIAGTDVTSFGTYTFEDEAVPFAPVVVFPQNYECVRGFVMPDGELVTGDVIFIGENGLSVVSEDHGDKKIIRFDAIGSQVTQDCIQLNPAVLCIKFHQSGGDTPLRISRESNTIFLSTSYEMAEICEAKKDSQGYASNDELPINGEDVCDPEPEPDPPEPAAEVEDTGECPTPDEHQGNYYILGMSSGIDIKPVEYPTATVYTTDSTGSITALDQKNVQGLSIGLKGL